jgi:hypothetical protein
MKITEITKTYGRTVNIGKFNSLRFETTASGELEPGEDVGLAGAELYGRVKAETEADITAKLDEIKEGRDEIFKHVVSDNERYGR